MARATNRPRRVRTFPVESTGMEPRRNNGGRWLGLALCALVAGGCIAPRTPAPFDPFQRYAQPPFGVVPPPPAAAMPGPGMQYPAPPFDGSPIYSGPVVGSPTQPTPAQPLPARASLQLRASSPAQAERGETFPLELSVTNTGTPAARDVTVQFQAPPGSALVDSTPAAQTAGGLPTWRLGDLAAGQTQTIRVNVRADQAGAFNLCATARTIDGIAARDCARTTVAAAPAVQQNAALKVAISGPQKAKVGDEVTFAITVTNTGGRPATGLLLRADFDPGLQHEMDESHIERDLEDLPAGEAIEVGVTFRAVEAGRHCTDVTITADGGVSGAAHACVTTAAAAGQAPPNGAAQPPVGNPRVQVAHTVPAEATVGGMAEFLIVATNTGDVPLTQLVIKAQYDAPLKPSENGLPGNELGQLEWKYNSLAPGKSFRIAVQCACPRAAAEACGRVEVTSREGATEQAEACVAIVAAKTELSVTVSDLSDPVTVGKEFAYTVKVTNDGQVADRDIRVTVKLPPELVMVALGTISQPSSMRVVNVNGRDHLFSPLATLAAGEAEIFRIRVRAEKAGTVTFQATVDSAGAEQVIVVEETTELSAP